MIIVVARDRVPAEPEPAVTAVPLVVPGVIVVVVVAVAVVVVVVVTVRCDATRLIWRCGSGADECTISRLRSRILRYLLPNAHTHDRDGGDSARDSDSDTHPPHDQSTPPQLEAESAQSLAYAHTHRQQGAAAAAAAVAATTSKSSSSSSSSSSGNNNKQKQQQQQQQQ